MQDDTAEGGYDQKSVGLDKSMGVSAGLLAMDQASVTICAPTVGIRHFEFDHGWDPAAPQPKVYETTVAPLAFDLLNGRSGTVLAYGQTGSGKTHTMWGEVTPRSLGGELPASAGVVPRVVADVLAALPHRCALAPELRMSCVEVFGDSVTDLLNGGGSVGAWQGVAARAVTSGLADVVVEDAEHAVSLLQTAEDNKRRAATEMNERSSRAHCLLILTLVQHVAGGSTVRSTLTLADLGGCETLKKSKASGERMQEAVNINLGLLALKNVIIALHQRRTYVPYQDNKLTMLLQALAGRSLLAVVTSD